MTLVIAPAIGGSISTPECQQDLARAGALVAAVVDREKLFVRDDLARNCGLLRQNLIDMVKAREPMNRCLTGHDHGENVGQMDASIGDIRDVLARECGR